jgi:glyoxylase-like metal-dependent hydrolase (beta-lactamase superfamily II)
MSEAERYDRPPTIGDPSALIELADGVWAIPDTDRTPHVPNVGIIVGEHAALIVDSGLGADNADRVFLALRSVSSHQRVYLTQTHFHPEHGYGAQRLQDRVVITYNQVQFAELHEKGQMFLDMFRGFSEHMAAALEDVVFVTPDVLYADRAQLDLGGVTVELQQRGPAHTRGDQTVFLPDSRILFTGDLVEERFFPILCDGDAFITRWITALAQLEEQEPQVVVPGHGAIGGFELLSSYKETLAGWLDRVRTMACAGVAPARIESELSEQILLEYPDWENREWVVPMISKCLESLTELVE